MLTEWIGATKDNEEGRRRWYTDEAMDLIVWYSGSDVTHFQLCYDKQHEQHAIVWSSDGLLRHQRVDTGESRPGSPKSAPIIAQEANKEIGELEIDFLRRAENLDPILVSFVRESIAHFSDQADKAQNHSP
ncbi:MAG: hypothetical protein ACLFP4_05075 [Spirochaetales bacterium]